MSTVSAPLLSVLLVPALLLLPACGGEADPKAAVDAGMRALGEGSHAAALEHFEEALAGLDAGDPQWMKAKKGALLALAHSDPPRAADDLVAFSQARDLSLDDYHEVAKALIDGKHVEPARKVLKAAWSEHPGSLALKRLVLKALSAEDVSAGGTGNLGDMGYTSGGNPDEALETDKFEQDLAEFLGLDTPG